MERTFALAPSSTASRTPARSCTATLSRFPPLSSRLSALSWQPTAVFLPHCGAHSRPSRRGILPTQVIASALRHCTGVTLVDIRSSLPGLHTSDGLSSWRVNVGPAGEGLSAWAEATAEVRLFRPVTYVTSLPLHLSLTYGTFGSSAPIEASPPLARYIRYIRYMRLMRHIRYIDRGVPTLRTLARQPPSCAPPDPTRFLTAPSRACAPPAGRDRVAPLPVTLPAF